MLGSLSPTYWIGEKPFLSLWIRFIWRRKFKLTNNTRFVLLKHRQIDLIKKETLLLKSQEIRENSKQEKTLLAKSWLRIFPHEVWQVRIISARGIALTGKIHHGGPYHSGTFEKLKKEIALITRLAIKRGIPIEEVELVHTHPTPEVLLIKENKCHAILSCLSPQDLRTAYYISQFLPYPLRVCAITPALNYSTLF